MDFTDKTAVVTGSTRGIGNAIARKLAENGAKVVINGTSNAEKVEAVVSELKAAGYEAAGVLADIGTRDGVDNLIKTAVDTFGGVDIMVNNAGITRDGLVMRMSEDDWDDVIRINLTSAFLCAKASLRYMIKKRWGRIINMSSVVGISGNPGQSNYAASKAGIIGFTKALAKEVGSRGITVNAIAPGFIETDMTEQMTPEQAEQIKQMVALGHTGATADVAEAVAFLCSDKGGYITGHVLNIDGGMGGL